MSNCDRHQDQQQYLEQLKAELQQRKQQLAAQQRNEVLRLEFARQFGHELLALSCWRQES